MVAARRVNCRELGLMLKHEGPARGAQRIHQFLEEGFASGQMRPDQFSIRDLYEHVVHDGRGNPCGRELVERMDSRRKSGGWRLLEAANAADTMTFANISGQIFFNKMLEGYNAVGLLWPELVDTFKTNVLGPERIPGIGGVGDETEVVEEKQPFPYVGMNEEWVEAPATKKRGFIVSVTREAIVADQTGLLMRRAAEGGTFLSLNKEKRVLDVVLGVTNTYKRNGVASNTYLTSGAYINSHTNPLVDWTSIEAAELLFDSINDPNTGEPYLFAADALIVPSYLLRTAQRILAATQVRHEGAGGNQTYSPSPMDKGYYGAPAYKVLASPYVKRRTNSATTWFFGNAKKSFGYREVWDVESIQAPANSEAEFERDIQYRNKFSEMGEPYVENPRYMTKNV